VARIIRIITERVTLKAVLAVSEASETVYSALPWEGPFQTWGDEIYFEFPVTIPADSTATTRVRIGDIGYWPRGRAIAIFFGPTPISVGKDPLPMEPVLPIGKIMGRAILLRGAMSESRIRLEPAR
jgi:uncharacterized protein